MNRYRLVHTTEFLYDGPVSESYNEVRLRPIDDDRQSCLSFRLITNPASRGSSYKDGYENWIHVSSVLPHHRRLRIEAESVVLVHEAPVPDPGSMPLAELDAMRSDLFEEHFEWLAPSSYVPYLPELAEISKTAEACCDGTVADFAETASDWLWEQDEHLRYVYVSEGLLKTGRAPAAVSRSR